MHNYFKNKKVFVTGHTGFVGAWLCLALKYFGADVTGFTLREEPSSLYSKIKNGLKIHSVYGDLRDAEAVNNCYIANKPDILFHIAAFGFVKECFDDPDRAFSSNVDGTLNLFQTIRNNSKECRIVVASSDKVYCNSGREAYLFCEDDALGGTDPYSASKTCEDILARSFFDTYLKGRNTSLCILRPSNILGGGDHNMNRLIPSIYYNMGLDKAPEIRNPNAVRPWQNIFDIVDAYLTVAESFAEDERVYNVGPEPEGIKTVGEIAEYVSGLYGKNYSYEKGNDNNSIEKQYLGLSIDKIKKELNWRPQRTLEQTLAEIYEFYTKDDGKNTYELCMSQIERYYNEYQEV